MSKNLKGNYLNMEKYKEVVTEFKRIADNQLWNRVDDSFLIGVKDPADEEIYWCSLMGKDEELYGVSMYKGASGLYSYDYIRKKDGQRPDPEMATVQDTILVTLDEEKIFSDHHKYRDEDINRILEISKKKNLKILTTEKDYVKIPNYFKNDINYIEINLKIDDEKKLLKFIESKINETN